MSADVRVHRDVEIPMRDGTILRANVYLPADGGPVPAILCAHPYGKDALPRRTRGGYRINPQFRILRQTATIRISDETGWEAPDPAWWVPQGFAVVNLDVRGAGRSDGVGSLLSDAEAEDVYDAIEWIARQDWCTGAVGMLGVSYLAISQYKVAALRPPHLGAIVPWEGFTDAYRDFFYPGGVREIGFSRLWTTLVRRSTRMSPDLGREAAARPDDDAWWRSLAPDLGRIETPMLVCGSFSDANLHTRGSFRAFAEATTPDRHLFTHRGGKWAAFYSDEAKAAQLAFLSTHLRGERHSLPRVRLEVRERGDRMHEVRDEEQWPPSFARLQLHLHGDGSLTRTPPVIDTGVAFPARRAAARYSWTFDEDTEITGDATLRLWVSAASAGAVSLFAGLSKWTQGRFVPFEGSYGFGRDFVTTGFRRVDVEAEARLVEIEFAPSATLFRSGDELRLHVSGRQLSPRNPLWGAFPALYHPSRRVVCTLHSGQEYRQVLDLPAAPRGAVR
ncbi:CocE/NonD family hydrolase [Microbacterium sp. CPCC 204701]|uniref:CocE/NonD family hydrolase n=1 Tax=Microbacterium sp. CPCC 204701 TaxID=2493084 RepID=UPI00197CA00B|nr:CocE/NonD family hydrolase [Microbacterium sp. CPCC 204701]